MSKPSKHINPAPVKPFDEALPLSKARKRTQTLALTTLLSLSVLGLTGCFVNVANTYEAKDGRKSGAIEDQRVTWNWGQNWAVYVTELRERKKPGELLRVDFEINNRWVEPRAFRYKFEWFDEDGLAIRTDGNWREATIAAGEYRTFGGIAPTLEAVDFRLSLASKQ